MSHLPTHDAPKTAYLRGRPFLIVEHYKKPAKGVRTERKGWLKLKGALRIEENPLIVDRVSDRQLIRASVVIDVLNNTVIRNNLSDGAEATLKHFTAKYADIIEQGKSAWARRSLASLA